MKRIIIITNAILLAGIFTVCNCTNKENKYNFIEPTVLFEKQAYYAYIMNSINIWEQVVSEKKSAISGSSKDTIGIFKLGRAQYGLLTACIGNQDKSTYEKYIAEAENTIKTLLKLTPEWSKVHALQAGILSVKLAFEPEKGMILGPKSSKAISKAIKYNNNEPTALHQQGGSKFHTPEKFGGSLTEAIKSYSKAIELYESGNEILEFNWQYLSTLTWYGIALEKDGRIEEAIHVYEKALNIEPDYGWIKYSLLPTAKSKL